jgi:hypothetical protein
MNRFAARSRRAVPAFIAAVALGVAGCGEGDVESGVGQGAEKAKEAGKKAADKAEKGAREAADKAEKGAKEAKRDAEK